MSGKKKKNFRDRRNDEEGGPENNISLKHFLEQITQRWELLKQTD